MTSFSNSLCLIEELRFGVADAYKHVFIDERRSRVSFGQEYPYSKVSWFAAVLVASIALVHSDEGIVDPQHDSEFVMQRKLSQSITFHLFQQGTAFYPEHH
jgi:hypothetical protein